MAKISLVLLTLSLCSAAFGGPTYRRLVVHRDLDAANGVYANIQSYAEDETVDLAGRAVKVAALLSTNPLGTE